MLVTWAIGLSGSFVMTSILALLIFGISVRKLYTPCEAGQAHASASAPHQPARTGVLLATIGAERTPLTGLCLSSMSCHGLMVSPPSVSCSDTRSHSALGTASPTTGATEPAHGQRASLPICRGSEQGVGSVMAALAEG